MIKTIHLFQVFRKVAEVPKPYYTPQFRKAFQVWEKTVNSHAGHLKDGILYLLTDKKQEFAPENTSIIILQDTIGYGVTEGLDLKRHLEKSDIPAYLIDSQLQKFSRLFTFNRGHQSYDFGLFSIKKNPDDEFELSLKLNQYWSYTNKPSRENHKLCLLKKDNPVQIRFNSKSDNTMSAGKQRTYCEEDYIIEYLGETQEISFEPLNRIGVEKSIPVNISKHIDLRKRLY